MRRIALAASILLATSGCGSNVRVEQRGDTCAQVRKKTFIGIQYSKQEAVVRCPNQ